MAKTALYNMEGKAIGEVELSDEIFAAPINEAAMHLMVRSYLAAQRQGTQSALTRGEVRGGGRKIYRQKGTGNARHHGNRAPQFKHGGVVFAPKPRDYDLAVNKKVRRLAFKSAMTSKLNAGEIIVVDKLELKEAKTKLMAETLKKLQAEKKALVILPEREESVIRATANLPQAKVSYVNTLNVYDILNAGKVVLTNQATSQAEGIDEKRYVFEVDIKANKAEIKSAIEAVFAEDGVKVAKVNTLRTIGKMKRQGRTQGMTPETKKAYVILKKDSKPIKFFEGMAQ